MSTYIMTYGGESVLVELGAPESQITVDGEPIGHQYADASCRVDAAMRLAARYAWGPVFDTAEDAERDGRSDGDAITIWADVGYEPETTYRIAGPLPTRIDAEGYTTRLAATAMIDSLEADGEIAPGSCQVVED